MAKPNLLLILTDHWRGDCLGRLGHPAVETPHLDSISAHGVTFTRGYTPSPSCIPARRCLVTGMTPNRTGMLGYRDGVPWRYRHTMAGCLRDAGYQTISVGKTHYFPNRAHLGYEQLTVSADYREWIDAEIGQSNQHSVHGVPGNSWIARPHHLPEHQIEECWFTSQAMERLQKRDPTRPWFLTLSFNGPHPPWAVPQHYLDHFMAKDLPEPIQADWSEHFATEARYPLDANATQGRIHPALNKRARAAFYAYLAFIDAQIGRFWDWLVRAGLAKNTLLVFTSDHGEMLGDHNLWRKTYAYEPSARIPFIVVPPRDWKGQSMNVEDERLVGWEDIMPTFLDAAGAQIPDTVEGRSLLPLLRGEDVSWREWYHHEHALCYADNTYQCLTSPDWKYIWNPLNGRERLFDLAHDREERHDLASDPAHAATLTAWRERLARHLAGRPEGWSDGKRLTPCPYPTWREPAPDVWLPDTAAEE